MSTLLPIEKHLSALALASRRLEDLARSADLDAPVPTCPEWRVRDLVAHQGMVHRWAAGHVTGSDEEVPEVPEILAIVGDDLLLDWFAEGADRLHDVLLAAPDDVEALVFLRDAPSPRRFWARRQAHETTIHAVDALSGSLRRVPSSGDVALDADVAADGIDELVCGFFPRGRSRLDRDRPYVVSIEPEDHDSLWLLRIGDGSFVASRVDGRADPAAVTPSGVEADVVWSGSAVQLYLSLWNRCDEIRVSEPGGVTGVLDQWRRVQHVQWG